MGDRSRPAPPWAAAYDAVRDLDPHRARAACFAPATSLYLDTRGDVSACCHSHLRPLGNVATATLQEIWHGPEAAAARAALARYELPPACRFCRWQVDDGNLEGLYARQFDRFQPADDTVGWPAQMEFSLSNRCNLECVMCSGDFSSAIRSRRERRAPLPSPYGEAFFTQLRPFLAHLHQARFLGGEPFLIPEYQRIWDLLIADGLTVDCDVTTNGTVWTDRVERTLAALPFTIAVSLDGASREVVERVRRGADFDVVLANARRFADHCARNGRPFALTYCLMAVNWQDFPAFLHLADDLGADVHVNTVMWPAHLSLYALPLDELRTVVDALGAAGDDPRLLAEVDRLRHWCERAGQPDVEPAFFEAWSPLPEWLGIRRGRDTSVDEARTRLTDLGGGAPDELRTDVDDVVVGLGPSGKFLDAGAEVLVGRSYGDALRHLAAEIGELELVADEVRYGNGAERHLVFAGEAGRTRVVATTVVGPDRSATTLATRVAAFPGASR